MVAFPELSAPVVDFISGGMAGALSVTVTQPLDTLRIRMQALRPAAVGAPLAPAAAHALGGGLGGSSSSAAAARAGKAPVQILASMVRQEGSLAPFRGMSFPLAASALQHALLFQVYGTTLRLLQQRQQQQQQQQQSQPTGGTAGSGGPGGTSLAHAFIAGSAAGFAQSLLGCPVEMLKIRLQLQTAPPGSPAYQRASVVLRGVLTREGPRGLYRGVTVTMLRDTPSFGVYFATYLAAVRWLEPAAPSPPEASPPTQLLAGGTAGCLAWASIYPLDVIKSRMQAAGAGAPGGPPRAATWLHFARAVVAEGGPRALFAGLQPTLLRGFVMDAVTFLGYSTAARTLTSLSRGGAARE